MGGLWNSLSQKQFKIHLLILLITLTHGEVSDETTISPTEDEGDQSEGSGQVQESNLLKRDPPHVGKKTPQPGARYPVLSQEDRKNLRNMVLVDLLCSKLKPAVIPSCSINTRQLDAFLLKDRTPSSIQEASVNSEPPSDGRPGSSTPSPESTANETVDPAHGADGARTAGEPVQSSDPTASLLSLFRQRLVPSGPSPPNWTRLFTVFSTILQKVKSLQMSKLGFPGLKEYLLTHGLKEDTLQTLLGLVITKSVTRLHEKTNFTSAQLGKTITAVEKVQVHSLLAVGTLFVLAVLICLCWVSQNVAAWNEKRKARRELRREERASRFLHGLQQARYRQQAEEVRLMAA